MMQSQPLCLLCGCDVVTGATVVLIHSEDTTDPPLHHPLRVVRVFSDVPINQDLLIVVEMDTANGGVDTFILNPQHLSCQKHLTTLYTDVDTIVKRGASS